MTAAPADEVIARALARIRRNQQAARLRRRAQIPAADTARFHYLDALDAAPAGLPISEIAATIGVDRPRASRLTTELLDEGLIKREPQPGDARFAVIRLADKGHTLVAHVHEDRRRAVAQALTDFTPAEAQNLAALLDRFVAAWPTEGGN